MKYLVTITETLARDIIINAESKEDAERQVEKLYREEKIVLDYTNFSGKPLVECKQEYSDTEVCTVL